MSQGYASRYNWAFWGSCCRHCRSGPKSTFICVACDHVCRAPGEDRAPSCPHCRQLMRNMGTRWRVGPKGKRTMPPPPEPPPGPVIRHKWSTLNPTGRR